MSWSDAGMKSSPPWRYKANRTKCDSTYSYCLAVLSANADRMASDTRSRSHNRTSSAHRGSHTIYPYNSMITFTKVRPTPGGSWGSAPTWAPRRH
eukprot:1781570-Pyramimonas_sp.AAC.1